MLLSPLQVWGDFTQQLADQSDAESVLYLSPLQSSPASSTSSTATRSSLSMRRESSVLTGITATPLLRGHIGDCCDDHSPTAPRVERPWWQSSPPSQSASQAHHSSGISSLPVEANWGVVLQSRMHEALNGCYILHTSSSRDPDCQCTHFNLVRAQEGQGVSEQWLSAWLA